MSKSLRTIANCIAYALFFVLAGGAASGAEKRFGPFLVNELKPDIIALNGEIDTGSALNFRRALQAAPGAKLVTLNSPGGNVQMGLLIADDIHQRKLATAGACAILRRISLERGSQGASCAKLSCSP